MTDNLPTEPRRAALTDDRQYMYYYIAFPVLSAEGAPLGIVYLSRHTGPIIHALKEMRYAQRRGMIVALLSALALADAPATLAGIDLKAVMSHLACGDEPDHPAWTASRLLRRHANADEREDRDDEQRNRPHQRRSRRIRKVIGTMPGRHQHQHAHQDARRRSHDGFLDHGEEQ